MAAKLNSKFQISNSLPAQILPKAKLAAGRQSPNSKFQTIINDTQKKWKRTIEEFKFNESLIAIWELIGFCDKLIEKERPWERSNKQLSIIYNLLSILANIAKMLQPFLPETSDKILEQTKKVEKGKPLFPKI